MDGLQHVAQERVQNSVGEQIGAVPVPQIWEPIEGPHLVPQERVQNRTPEQESVQNRTPEQIVDVLVPQITEDGLYLVPQEREQNRTQEQIADSLVPPIMEAVLPLHHRNACKISRRSRLWISLCLRTWEIMPELCVLHHRSSCKIVPSCARPRKKFGMVFSMCLRSACHNVMGIATSRVWTSPTCLVPEWSRT